MKVYVVMEEYTVDDDGDYDREIEAVHASLEGAQANLTPDPKSGYGERSRTRYVVEMEVL